MRRATPARHKGFFYFTGHERYIFSIRFISASRCSFGIDSSFLLIRSTAASTSLCGCWGGFSFCSPVRR
nr:MAG TPA: hypothetical protein [Caudoviricetes sp.]